MRGSAKNEKNGKPWARIPRKFEPAYRDWVMGLTETESQKKQAKRIAEHRAQEARNKEFEREQQEEKIRPRTLEELCRQSAVSPDHNKKRKWHHLNATEMSERAGYRIEMGGWEFPIFDAQGNSTGESYVRLDDYITEGFLKGAERNRKKYFQLGVGSLVWFDPTVDWKDKDKIRIIVIVEGVKKAAAINDSELRKKYGVYAIAIGGAYSWHLESDWTLHPEIAKYLASAADVAQVVVLLDSDVKLSTLHAVREQELRLAQALINTLKREVSIVKCVHLPRECGKIDDYLRENGAEEAWQRIEETEVTHRCMIAAFKGHLGYLHRKFVYDQTTHTIATIPTDEDREVHYISEQDFLRDHKNRKVKWWKDDKEEEAPAAAIWMASDSLRIDVKRVVSVPMNWDEWHERERSPLLDDGTLNAFWPAEYEPIEGNTDRLDTLFKCITDKPKHWMQLEQYMAYKVRHPGEVMGYAEFLYSLLVQGIGKSTYVSWFMQVLGKHNCHEITTDLLTKDIYNAWMENKLLIALHEGLDPPSLKEARSVGQFLQQYVGHEGDLSIRPMYGPVHKSKNLAIWVACTNSAYLGMPDNARRFDAIHGRDDERLLSSDQFNEQVLGMKRDEVTGHWKADPEEDRRFFNALLHRLLYVTDLTGFNPRLPREDDDRAEYGEAGRKGWISWMRRFHDGTEEWPERAHAKHVGETVDYITIDLMLNAICAKFDRSSDQPKWDEVKREMPKAGYTALGQIKSRNPDTSFSLWARDAKKHAQAMKNEQNEHKKITELFLTEFPSQNPAAYAKFAAYAQEAKNRLRR
jgi:hypothetical protein